MKTNILQAFKKLFFNVRVATASLLLGAGISQAQTQMPNWVLPPNRANFVAGSTSALPLASATVYSFSNGVYDNAGNLVFYVRDFQVYKGDGTNIGTLTSFTQPVTLYTFSAFTSKEIAVVPIPNTCKQYYVFWLGSSASAVSSALRYAIVNLDNNTVTNQSTSANLGIFSEASGLAVSKVFGSVRRLYVVDNAKITRYDVSASISGPVDYTFPATTGQKNPTEVDLSHDGSRIAWGVSGAGGNAYMARHLALNTGTGAVSGTPYAVTTPTGYAGSSFGVEFSADNNSLYVNFGDPAATTNNGVYKVLVNSTPTSASQIANNGTTIYRSHLELGYDGKLFVVNTSNKLVSIDPSVLNPPLTADSRFSSINVQSYGPSGNYWSLPDQIDGENYTYFRGIGQLIYPTPVVKSNGVVVTPSGSTYTVYNCNPLTLTSTTSNYQNYTLTIYTSNPSGVQGTQLYTSGAVAATYPDAQDISILGSGNIRTTPGYYLVRLKFSNGCDTDLTKDLLVLSTNQSSFSGLGVNNNGVAVTPASGVYNVYNCQSINLVPTGNNMIQYRISIQSSNASGGVVTGAGTISYVGSWVAGSASAVDLRTLSSNYLLTNTGYYLVTLDIKDNCNPQVTRTALLNVSSLTLASADYQINYGDGTYIPIPFGQTYASPISTGIRYVSINATFSSGYLDYYWMKIEKINASNGSVITTLCNTPVVTNIPGKTSATLGNIPINGYMANKCSQGFDYLAQPANLNQLYRITFNVGNVCGTSNKTSYITNVDANWRLGEEDNVSDHQALSAQGHNAYPNPSNGKSSIRFVLDNSAIVNMTIRDAQGNILSTPLKNVDLGAGEHLQNVDLSGLPDGLYYYNIKTDKEVTGKILKAGK